MVFEIGRGRPSGSPPLPEEPPTADDCYGRGSVLFRYGACGLSLLWGVALQSHISEQHPQTQGERYNKENSNSKMGEGQDGG